MEITVKITNAFTGKVEFNSIESVRYSNIDALHSLYHKAYPDCHVNFSWGKEGNASFICGAPYNMMQDEIAHSEGRMTWEEYSEKWYSKK